MSVESWLTLLCLAQATYIGWLLHTREQARGRLRHPSNRRLLHSVQTDYFCRICGEWLVGSPREHTHPERQR